MIGGTVIETVVLPDRVWVNVRDERDTCAIYVESSPLSRSISEGDALWWQGDCAMWTARNRAGKPVGKPDTRIKRIGFSGVKRPTPQSP